ncbi:MAG: citrate lyase acyl carrier protein [bacterium]|nr:citrate lyase acyl carrier protein [bacterium]
MKLKTTAQSGSLESCDLIVVVDPVKSGVGRKIELESMVLNEYGDSIKKDIIEVLDKHKIEDVHLKINDRGALTPTIKARAESAILKSWKGEN